MRAGDQRVAETRVPPGCVDVIAQFFDRVAIGPEPELACAFDGEETCLQRARQRRVRGGMAAVRLFSVERPDGNAVGFDPCGFNARVQIDETAAGGQQAVGAVQGMDHALGRHSSQGPGEDDGVERRFRKVQVVVEKPGCAGGDVALRPIGFEGSDSRPIRIDRVNRSGAVRVAPCQPAVAATDFEDPASHKIGKHGVERTDLEPIRIAADRHGLILRISSEDMGMRIGIVGAGMIGSTVARLWVNAGHEVLLASRHPETLSDLVKALGSRASAGTPRQAAEFGDVVMLTVPLNAMPDLATDLAPLLAGKVVIDTGNAYEKRDGMSAREASSHAGGSAGWAAGFFPNARWVKGFNTVYFKTLESEAHRTGDRVGIPLASDDRDAIELVAGLVRDAGFDPVIVGSLARGKEYEPDTSVYNTGMSGRDVRTRLRLPGV